jgi:hypothetical protein
MLAVASHVWPWQTPSWNWAEAWALLILLLVSVIPLRVPVKRREMSDGRTQKNAALFVLLLNGKDGRWSTSKASAVFWTYAVWFAFIAILLHTHGKGLDGQVLKQQYLLLLGLPVAAAVVAKGITQNKVETGKLATKQPDGPETNVLAGVGQLVANDSGQPDLLDFQYFGFNLILLAYFFTRFLGAEAMGLPELPDTLVALSGVSTTGYLGKKGLQQDTDPVISSIDPPLGKPGDSITIHGANFAIEGETDATVQFGDQSAPAFDVKVSAHGTKIKSQIPSGLTEETVDVRVINDRGVTSDPFSYTVNP